MFILDRYRSRFRFICKDKVASQVAPVIKNSPVNAGDVRDVDLIPESGRSPGGGHGYQLQCSFLENHMDRGAWWATVHAQRYNKTNKTNLKKPY